jgi:hypothetical protein
MNKNILYLIVGLVCFFMSTSCREDDIKNPDTVYFEVGEIDPVHGDSYILPLTDPAEIKAARDIIKNGESKIVIAEIAKKPMTTWRLVMVCR